MSYYGWGSSNQAKACLSGGCSFLLCLKEFMFASSSQARRGSCDILSSSLTPALVYILLHGSPAEARMGRSLYPCLSQGQRVTNPASWCLKRHKGRMEPALSPVVSKILVQHYCYAFLCPGAITALGRWVCNLDQLLTKCQ